MKVKTKPNKKVDQRDPQRAKQHEDFATYMVNDEHGHNAKQEHGQPLEDQESMVPETPMPASLKIW